MYKKFVEFKESQDIVPGHNEYTFQDLLADEQAPKDAILHYIEEKNPYNETKDIWLKGFELPIWIEEHDDYDKVIKEELEHYQSEINKKLYWKKDPDFLEELDKVVRHIKDAIHLERCGKTTEAQKEICAIIEKCCSERFFVHPLTKNFAFRETAAFEDGKELEARRSELLTFFRCRKGKVDKKEEMYPLPKEKLSYSSAQRYSLAGIPCLYLATTTYCCWMEIGRPEEFSASSYQPTKSGEKLRILNLAFNQQQMINLDNNDRRAAYLLFPLIMAVSVSVKNPRSDANFRPEYTISHLLMRCLNALDIHGIAYLSSRIDDVLGLPHTINLAIPVFDETKTFADFLITDPGTFSPQKGLCKEKQDASSPQKHLCKEKQDAFELSYLNKFYIKEDDVLSYISCYGCAIHYPKTSFSDIDNYLAGRTYYPMNNEK